jgi:hypothetical protein
MRGDAGARSVIAGGERAQSGGAGSGGAGAPAAADAGRAAPPRAGTGGAAGGGGGTGAVIEDMLAGDPLLSGKQDGPDVIKPGFCDRPSMDKDAVRELFCASTRPELHSLHDLQVALDIVPAEASDTMTNYPLLLGHSTALFGHIVSPLNPRALVLGYDLALAFQRGTQHVELISGTRDPSHAHFYLLSFEQACNARAGGCVPGDLYTPRLESDWTRWAIYDDEQLANTPGDCRQCHQRGSDAPKLLMRELEKPWTHFFDSKLTDQFPEPGVRGSDLLQDYLAARGDERYAGIDGSTYDASFAFILEQQVGTAQPLLFDAPAIERERYPKQADGTFAATPLPSPTWNAAYEAFKRGEQLALPYVEPRVTDATKAAQLTAAYQSFRSGTLPAEMLPDMADVFSDDPQTRALLGLQTEPGATAVQALIQACGGCHNDVLDQSITRAKFNIDLARMSRTELDLAIKRVQLPRTAVGAMPPVQFRQLDADGRARLLELLRRPDAAGMVDASLQHAAKEGMRGGARVGQ